MNSVDNKNVNCLPSDADFTVIAYGQLIKLAVDAYSVADYRGIPWGERFVLWRHDCDFSLNRAFALAKIEADVGLRSTYFLNPHSEFYNLLEGSQLSLIHQIVGLGHDVGLHFDGAFYPTLSEESLHDLIIMEANLLEQFIGIRPAAFSFHNPSAFHLTCEAETYGGLVNCYSKRFKTEVPYCSDSNGHWRFRRLADVLMGAKDPCIQVLTHPGWWQDDPAPPRQRVFKCIYGRAAANMCLYDKILENGGRTNLSGKSQSLQFLKRFDPKHYSLCDYLWNAGQHQTLFLELLRIHEAQLRRLCKAHLCSGWGVPAREVDWFLENQGAAADGRRVFESLFEELWISDSLNDETAHESRILIRNRLLQGCSSIDEKEIEDACVDLCALIEATAAWGLRQALSYDGLGEISSIGMLHCKSGDGNLTEVIEGNAIDAPKFQVEKWKAFIAVMMEPHGNMDISNSK